MGRTLFFLFWIAVGTTLLPVPGGTHSAFAAADFLSDEFYENEQPAGHDKDPLEPMNRVLFDFNDKMYFWVMEPVADIYSRVLPQDLRGCIGNFFWNLAEPVHFINALLQGRFADSGTIVLRFVVNSTLGVYGLGDPAAREFSLPPVEATLGGTLHRWGVGDGFYLVVPFYGPSTLRDFSGLLVDGLGMTPYYTWTDDLIVQSGIYAGKQTNSLSLHLGEYEQLKSVLFDPYIAFRNGYFQHRREQAEFQNSGTADPAATSTEGGKD